jgi:hypothetical protein
LGTRAGASAGLTPRGPQPRSPRRVWRNGIGYYQHRADPPPGEEPSGCRDVFLLTRAAFGVLLLPIGILLGAILALAFIVFLFNHAWWLGVLGLIAVAGGIYLYARWEQNHFRAQ